MEGVVKEKKRGLEQEGEDEEGVTVKKLKQDVVMEESDNTTTSEFVGLQGQPYASQ